jgi:hypothetical protein
MGLLPLIADKVPGTAASGLYSFGFQLRQLLKSEPYTLPAHVFRIFWETSSKEFEIRYPEKVLR